MSRREAPSGDALRGSQSAKPSQSSNRSQSAKPSQWLDWPRASQSARRVRGGIAALVAVGLVALAGVARSKLEGDTARADKARALSLELSTKEAGEALAGADPKDPLLAIERARVALYEGRCVEAAGLVRPEWIIGDSSLAALVGAARG